MKLKRPLELNFNSGEQRVESSITYNTGAVGELSNSMQQYFAQLENENSELKCEINALREENKQINNTLQNLERDNRLLVELKSSLDESQEVKQKQLKSYIHKNMEVLKFFITKSLTKNAKQVESFLSLERYLSDDEIPLSFNGWPISPDVALVIAGMFRSEHIDYVIEFGSGTSTILFAKLFQKLDLLEKENRVLSFEHDTKYLKETQSSIKEHEVENLVDLYHAPLRALDSSENSRFYYDCDDKLSQFKKSIGQAKSHILILVDGPPGSLGEQSRFPAMEVILSYFSNHKLTFFIDDYQRDDEKEMVNRWIETLKDYSFQYEFEEIELEKGGALLRVN